jgi:hypothetical protein
MAIDKSKSKGAATAVEITRLIKAVGPLTKRLHLSPAGELVNDSAQCRMARCKLERVRLADWRAFGPLIEKTPRNGAWALGALREDLPDTAQLVVKGDPQTGQPGFVARTQSNFLYRPGAPRPCLARLRRKGHAGPHQGAH